MNEPVIELTQVVKRFGDHAVLDGLSLVIERGTSTVIMGESGSGKSVLIRLMNGLSLPDGGSVRLFGQDTSRISRAELRKLRLRVATLFQNYALFDSMTVAENVAFPMVENGRADHATIGRRVQELLELLQLSDAARLMPSELSGGMKKRVSLARALITDPEVVLFDEPTTGLDPVMIEFVDTMLLDIRQRFSITSVIISHDMASAFRLADSLAMLHKGRITFRGTPDEARTTEVGEVRRFTDSASSRLGIAGEQNVEATLDQPLTGLTWEQLPVPPEPPVVRVRDLNKSFGERKVLRGMNMYVLPGQVTTLIGGSGSGKTVMMKHILGLFTPDSGSVEVFGRDLASLDGPEKVQTRLRFGMLFQGAALFDSLSILENVAFPLIEAPNVKPVGRERALELAHQTLTRLKIDHLGSRMPAEISGGQKKRAGLARAIVANPDIIIYDEPTTGLDPVMTSYVNDMIVEAQAEFGTTALIVSHDMASTFRISQWIAMLYQGEIIAFGTPDDIRESDHPRVREFIFAGA
jgi:ABC-type transporter Mla maintaining outer membrane lipid asymmetry ATPase subunit MlaF